MNQDRKKLLILSVVSMGVILAGILASSARERRTEANEKTVSMQQVEEKEEINTEKQEANDQVLEDAQPTEGLEEDQASVWQEVCFSVKGEDTGELFQTSVFSDAEGAYLFLPGFARGQTLTVTALPEGNRLVLAGEELSVGDKIKDIVYEERYAASLFNDEKEPVAQKSLQILCSSKLPVVSLTTASHTVDRIHESKENEESGKVLFYDEAGRLLEQSGAKSIRGRGNSTFGLSKKPYAISMKKEIEVYGIPKGENFVLLADGYDETKLRNQLALSMAKELGMEHTPEFQIVDLYCNEEYFGIYLLCEQIDREEEMRKGFLLERELASRYEAEEKVGFETEQGDAYLIQSPSQPTEAQLEYITAYMQEFQAALWEADGIHKENGKSYLSYIDLDSFVKKYLVEEISKNFDGGVTSSFFYKADDTDETKLCAGPVWDYDVSFGNCNLDEIASNPIGMTKLNDHVLGTELFARLYEREEFYQEVVRIYKQQAEPCLEKLLNGEIDQMAKEIADAVRMDSLRNKELENRYQYYEDYENSVRYLKYFIETRKQFLDEVWLQGEVYHSITFQVNGEAWKKVYVKDGELPGAAPYPIRQDALFLGWYSTTHQVAYDEYKPIYEDVTFYALWQELE